MGKQHSRRHLLIPGIIVANLYDNDDSLLSELGMGSTELSVGGIGKNDIKVAPRSKFSRRHSSDAAPPSYPSRDRKSIFLSKEDMPPQNFDDDNSIPSTTSSSSNEHVYPMSDPENDGALMMARRRKNYMIAMNKEQQMLAQVLSNTHIHRSRKHHRSRQHRSRQQRPSIRGGKKASWRDLRTVLSRESSGDVSANGETNETVTHTNSTIRPNMRGNKKLSLTNLNNSIFSRFQRRNSSTPSHDSLVSRENSFKDFDIELDGGGGIVTSSLSPTVTNTATENSNAAVAGAALLFNSNDRRASYRRVSSKWSSMPRKIENIAFGVTAAPKQPTRVISKQQLKRS